MEPSTNKSVWLWPVAVILVVAYCIYAIVSAIYYTQTTGKLKLSASDPKATFSVTQDGKQASIAGSGHPTIRLKPGTYTVAATSNGRQASQIFTVALKQTTQGYIDLSKTSTLASPADISFSGMIGLLGKGITNDQANSLQFAFFKFRPTAKTVRVDADSIELGRHNPSDKYFKTNFKVLVDNDRYNAQIVYAGFSDIRLLLLDPGSGKQIFDSKTLKVQ